MDRGWCDEEGKKSEKMQRRRSRGKREGEGEEEEGRGIGGGGGTWRMGSIGCLQGLGVGM